MAQIFHRSANALARMSLILAGGAVVALGLAANELQRSPWVTRQGERAEQPVPFSHQHHVAGLGLNCQYCHTSVEKSSFAGIPPTRTCINCHSQIWTNAQLLEPVRASYREDRSLWWTRVHDLPDFVYFSHEIHIAKGVGCATCHGRVDEMPIMYAENSLQMEWCLDCHRNPAKNLRPKSEVYNMEWKGPGFGRHVWCNTNPDAGDKGEKDCTTTKPEAVQVAGVGDAQNAGVRKASWREFDDQMSLGKFLVSKYHVRTPWEITSCETCHR